MLVSRRTFFFSSLALPAFAAKKKPEALRPGILLILVDELPAFMLGGYGNKQVSTPHLDLLAQMGIKLPDNTSLQLKNVAAVTVTASLPPFARPGQTIDIDRKSVV